MWSNIIWGDWNWLKTNKKWSSSKKQEMIKKGEVVFILYSCYHQLLLLQVNGGDPLLCYDDSKKCQSIWSSSTETWKTLNSAYTIMYRCLHVSVIEYISTFIKRPRLLGSCLFWQQSMLIRVRKSFSLLTFIPINVLEMYWMSVSKIKNCLKRRKQQHISYIL